MHPGCDETSLAGIKIDEDAIQFIRGAIHFVQRYNRGTIQYEYEKISLVYNFNEHVTWHKINAWKNEKGAVMPWLLEGRPQNCQLADLGR